MISNYLINNLLRLNINNKKLAKKGLDSIYSFIERSNMGNKNEILNKLKQNEEKVKKGLYYGYNIGEGLGFTLIGAPIYRNISDAQQINSISIKWHGKK